MRLFEKRPLSHSHVGLKLWHLGRDGGDFDLEERVDLKPETTVIQFGGNGHRRSYFLLGVLLQWRRAPKV